MIEGAFADRRELTIAPMGTDAEEGYEIFTRVEEVAFACWWEVWRDERSADNAHVQMLTDYSPPGLM